MAWRIESAGRVHDAAAGEDEIKCVGGGEGAGWQTEEGKAENRT